MNAHPLAYLAEGKLHWRGDGSSREVESLFGRSLRDRAAQIHNRHAWKMQGSGARFMQGMLWGATQQDPAAFRIALTSVTRGRSAGEILYSLETDEISGVFAVDETGAEQRLFHPADFRIRHLAMHPDGSTIAASICHNDFIANLAILNGDGTDMREVSEGDSADLAPRWVPGSPRRLLYQSAGLGRDAGGRFSGTGAFAVQQIDLDSGAMECLAEDPEADLLGPQKTAEGTLYYIRRPRPAHRANLDPLSILKDTVLFPFRLSFAVFQFFNFFSMKYSGRPLSTARGAAQRMPDIKRMMVWGNLIDVERAMRESRDGAEDGPALVPSSWHLVRHSPAGKNVVAKGVLSFDLAPDGSVFYSNGSSIHRLAPSAERPERVHVGTMIEQIAAL